MTVQDIHFLDAATLPVTTIIHRPKAQHSWHQYDMTITDEDFIEHIRGANVIVTNKVIIDRKRVALLQQYAPDLKGICVAATGMNNIDLDACKTINVSVDNVCDYAAISVAEHSVMLMLALYRNLPKYMNAWEEKAWHSSQTFCHFAAPIDDISGKTLVILGNGAIGDQIAFRAKAFGVKVLFSERKGARDIRSGYVDFDRGVRLADIYCLACPYTKDNHHVINATVLEQLDSKAILINAARGPLVDELALAQALVNRGIGGAALDVVSVEPIQSENPLLALTKMKNLIVTPHVAWASKGAVTKLWAGVIDNVDSLLNSRN